MSRSTAVRATICVLAAKTSADFSRASADWALRSALRLTRACHSGGSTILLSAGTAHCPAGNRISRSRPVI